MKNKTLLYFLLVGVLVAPLLADSDASTPAPEPGSLGNETAIVESDAIGPATRKDAASVERQDLGNVTRKFPSPAEDESPAFKPPKIRKKILISNLKNATEKGFLPSDKYEKQVYVRTAAANGTGSAQVEDAVRVDSPGRNDTLDGPVAGNVTEGRKAKLEDGGDATTQNDTTELERDSTSVAGEGRSFDSTDLRRKNNPNFRYFNRKNKVTTSTTEQYGSKLTTSSYMYFTLGEVQKSVNNNYLNIHEDFEKNSKTHTITSNTPSIGTTAALPRGKPAPISDGNPVKNLVRLENGYYGPTDQTDWVPVVPIKSPASEKRLTTYTAQSIHTVTTPPGTTVRPPTYPLFKPSSPVTLRRKTNQITESTPLSAYSLEPERNNATEDVISTTTASNSIPVLDLSEDPSVGNLEFLKINRTAGNQPPARKVSVDVQKPNKFRGSVRYRPAESNASTVESNESLKLNATRVSNVTGDGLQKLEIPPTGLWEVAAVQDFSSVRISTTETSAVNKTGDHTATEKTAIEDSPQSRPTNESAAVTEVTKPKNIAKVQVLKNTISDKIASDNPMSIFRFSETEPPNNATKSVETSTAVSTTKPPPPPTTTTDVPEEDATHLAAIKVSEESGTTVAVAESSTKASARDASDTSRTGTNESTKDLPEDDHEIEFTLSREILKISTTPPSPVANDTQNKEMDMTTAKEEATTTEEVVTVAPVVAETEKEALYTTEESVPETTFRSITEPEIDMVTEVPADDVPVQPRQPATQSATAVGSTTSGYDVKPAGERENDIDISEVEEPTTTPVNETKMRPKEAEDEHREHHVPHHPGVHHEITEENVPAYLKLTVEAASWEELCRLKDDLRNAIIRMLDGTNVTAESIVFLNLNERNCQQKIEETKDDPPSNMPMFLPVNMFIMNENGDFDKNLSEAFLNVWGQYGLDFELPIRKVDFLSPLGGLYDIPNDSVGVSVIAAIVISCVAGLCVILLGILFVVMKRRQKRFNYGQRCTPVSLDAYSLDSVSIHNSVRRKGIRTSKRSYGNAAFDDPEVPSHSMNFAGLANFSADKDQLHEEFNIIPQVYPKTDELPAGAETKNRYANVIPLPETRVHLSVKDGDSLSDYINANYVRGLKGVEKLYIACQAPMESTVEDFWRMIWEQQCKVILMLTDLQENGVEKCFDYLPPNEVTDNLRLFGDYQVTMKKRDVKEKYIISHLKLKNMEANLWREVTHLWYLGWPDQGVPSEANSLIAFLIEARSQMKSQTGSAVQGPAVVHCSPGTGRTGTVIACDLCIREFEQTRMVDIPKCVFNLRKDRAGSVQTKDQYAFIYQVLNMYATKLTGGGLESI